MDNRLQELGKVVRVVAINDKIRITQFFRQGNIEAVNVSFWEVSAINAMPSNQASYWAQSFAYEWIGKFSFMLHPSCEYYKTILEVGPTLMDYGVYEGNDAGSATGQAAPPYVAIQVKQQVATKVTRGGYKRIPFVSEDLIVGFDTSFSSGQDVPLKIFYGELAVIPDFDDPEGGSFSLVPHICGRTNVGTTEAPIYELDWDKWNQVVQASALRNTHQISRDR